MKIKRITALFLALILTVMVAGCGQSSNSSSSKQNSSAASGSKAESAQTDTKTPPEPLDLTLYLWGDKPNQMDDILAEFRSKTADTLNMNLSINWTPLADYGNGIQLKLSAGEDVDFCFDAPWINMNTFIMQGNYRDLTGYFNNDAYPALKAAFDSALISNNLMGENADKLYGIPITQSYGGAGTTYLRGDLREKYGLPPIETMKDFEAFLEAVKQNDPAMVPFGMQKDAAYSAGQLIDSLNWGKLLDKQSKGIWDVTIGPGIVASCYIKDYQLVDMVLTNEPASAIANFPEPYNKADLSIPEEVVRWYNNGWISKDVVTVDSASAQFTSGKAASFLWDTANYNSTASALLQSVPEAKLEIFNPENAYVTGKKHWWPGSFTAWNFICIPVTTSDAKAERIMQFFEWMFTSSENHDLFEYGISGKNFIPVNDVEFTYPEGLDLATNYNLPGYLLTWNPHFIRYQQGLPEDVLNLMKRANDPDIYFDPMLSGFRFNGEPVKNELANPDFAILQAENNTLLLGIFPDVAAEKAKIEKKAVDNKVLQEDIKAIKAEVAKQIAPYLEARKLLDQKNNVVYPTPDVFK